MHRFDFKKWEWAMLAAAGFFFLVGITIIWAVNLPIPDLNSFDTRVVTASTKIYDRTSKVLLYDIHQDIRRTPVPFEAISPYLKNATIAIEDSDFYNHHGIKPLSILRALLIDIGSGRLEQGGSTITQQVIKNALLNKDRTISRKIKEVVLAPKLETLLTKDKILTIYLNEIPYGGNIYGIEEASQTFFHKHASELTLAESAYLAGIPQAPSFYSPYGNNRAKLNNRQALVLSRMRQLNLITADELAAAKKEKVVFYPGAAQGIQAPHFVLWVKNYLEQKYGEDVVNSKGFVVTTTLDADLQTKAEKIVKQYADSNTTKYNAHNAALVAIDPKTGDVLAMVGSKDYFDQSIDGNFNIALANRQPGSSFKPFVYATAFDKGYTPDTVEFDLKTQFDTSCPPGANHDTNPKCYEPVNYDGIYRGPMTLRNALAQSINIPAIKVLYLAGIADSIATAKRMGITTLSTPNQYGLTLVLGGGEVSLLDMTSAYSVFANDGIRNPYRSILKVEDSSGQVVENNTPNPNRVLNQNTARLINDVLSDDKARLPAYGANSALYFPGHDVAAKTGTTNDYRDAWILGYTPNLTVGAWAGNNDNKPMEKKVAGLIVAPMWNAFMKEAIANRPNDKFIPPAKPDPNLKPILRGIWQGGQTYTIDTVSGKLATNSTPPETRSERAVRSIHTILYWINRQDPKGPPTINPNNDPQFQLWEAPVRAWALSQGLTDESPSVIPTTTDDIHHGGAQPSISITSPTSAMVIKMDNPLTVSVSINQSEFSITQLDFFLNGTYLGSTKNQPWNFSFTPSDTGANIGNNELKVVAYDSVRNSTETTSQINITN